MGYAYSRTQALVVLLNGGSEMTRPKPGFHDRNGEFVTADARVEYRFGARHGTVNAIFQDGEAEVMFDDNADLYLVKWDHICKLPS